MANNKFSTLNITDINVNEEIDFMRNLYIITRLLNLPLAQIFHENGNLDEQKSGIKLKIQRNVIICHATL